MLLHELGAERYADALAEHRRVDPRGMRSRGRRRGGYAGRRVLLRLPHRTGCCRRGVGHDRGARCRADPRPRRAAHRDAAAGGGGLRRRRRPSGRPYRRRGSRRPGARVGVHREPRRASSSPTSGNTASRTSRPPSASISSATGHSRRSSRCTGRTCPCRPRRFSAASASWPRSPVCYRTARGSSRSPAPGERARRGSRSTRLRKHRTRSRTASGGCRWRRSRDARLVTSAVAQALSVEEEPGRELEESLAARLAGKRALLVLDNAEHLMPEVASRIARAPRPVRPDTGRHEPRAAPAPGRAGLFGAAACRRRRRRAVPQPRTGDRLRRQRVGVRRRALFAPGQSAACARARSRPLGRLLAGATRRATLPASRPAQGRAETPIRASRRCARRSSGRTTCSSRRSSASSARCPCSPAAARSRRRRRCATPTPTRCSRSSTRASSGGARTSVRVTGCSRRSVSSQQSGWLLRAKTVQLRRKHAEHYLAVALSAGLAPDVEGQMRHDLVIPERDNMRAALAWACDNAEWDLGLELFVALENYWATNAAHEGSEWAQTLLSSAPADSSRPRFRALRVQGGMENILGQPELSRAALRSRRWPWLGSSDDELGVAILLHRLATTAVHEGDMERVRVLAEESLAAFRRVGFAKGEAQALTSLAEVRQADGDLEGALELLEESRADGRDVRLPLVAGGRPRREPPRCLLELGRLDDARSTLEQALRSVQAMHDRSAIVYELGLLAEIHARRGESERARDAVGSYRGRGGDGAGRQLAPRAGALPAEPHGRRVRGRTRGRPRTVARRRRGARARRRRYLTRSMALKPAGMTPNSAKASSQGCASDGRRWVANEVRFIFAITLASMGTYFARILALAASFLS